MSKVVEFRVRNADIHRRKQSKISRKWAEGLVRNLRLVEAQLAESLDAAALGDVGEDARRVFYEYTQERLQQSRHMMSKWSFEYTRPLKNRRGAICELNL